MLEYGIQSESTVKRTRRKKGPMHCIAVDGRGTTNLRYGAPVRPSTTYFMYVQMEYSIVYKRMGKFMKDFCR